MTGTLAADPVAGAVGASHIDWKDGSFQDVDFLRPGRARTAWSRLDTAQIGTLSWDRVGRIRMTPSGTEWFLARAFATEADLKGTLAEHALSERIRSGVAIGEAPKFPFSGVDVCLTTLRFLRRHGVCCRMLLDFEPSSDLSLARCRSVAEDVRAHVEILSSIRRRVWVRTSSGRSEEPGRNPLRS